MTVGTESLLPENERRQNPSDPLSPLRSREVPGRYIVISLLCLGIAATALLFIYWDRQTKPFRPLREAIGREFRHSRPNVEGGRPKGRGPWTLRVSMTVDFPPAEDSPRANQIFDRVIEIAGQYQDLSKIDKVEVNLIQFVPQELAKTRKFTWTAKEPAGPSIPQ
ncbi:MAG: hypothetical protein WCH39_06350 [Schlesneria sp.]|jgi:hypothetical protein